MRRRLQVRLLFVLTALALIPPLARPATFGVVAAWEWFHSTRALEKTPIEQVSVIVGGTITVCPERRITQAEMARRIELLKEVSPETNP